MLTSMLSLPGEDGKRAEANDACPLARRPGEPACDTVDGLEGEKPGLRPTLDVTARPRDVPSLDPCFSVSKIPARLDGDTVKA